MLLLGTSDRVKGGAKILEIQYLKKKEAQVCPLIHG
jgi:hypothetical protein